MERKHRFRLRLKYFILAGLVSYIIICQSCMLMRTSGREARAFFDEKHTEFKDRTFRSGKHAIHYIETGESDRPTLVFVHGSPGSWDVFKDYLSDSLLLSKFRMIAIDRPGFGHSNFGKAQNLSTQTKWIAEFLKSAGNGQQFVLVGHSLGGPVVAKLVAENPSMYGHLVILAGSLDPNEEKPEKWRSVIKSIPVRYLIPGALRPSNDELWDLKSDLEVLHPELKNVTCDVTILHGTKDPLVPYGNVDFMVREFVSAKSVSVISIENANHFIPWEHFELIRNVLYTLKI